MMTWIMTMTHKLSSALRVIIPVAILLAALGYRYYYASP